MEEKSDLYKELKEKNKTVLMLTSLLQRKEEEIELLKADLDDSVSELGTVCDVSFFFLFINFFRLTKIFSIVEI